MNSLKFIMAGAVTAAVATFASDVSAATLNAVILVDNGYTAHISTDDNVQGVQFLAGRDWTTSQAGSVELTEGVTNYLHIKAYDTGGPAAFLGTFSLTGNGFSFANGLQTLTTGEGFFRQSETGWGSYSDVTQIGPQGGSLPTVDVQSPDAIWIWSDDHYNDNAVYFTVAINAVAPVPLPAALPLLLASLGGLGLVARRRKAA